MRAAFSGTPLSVSAADSSAGDSPIRDLHVAGGMNLGECVVEARQRISVHAPGALVGASQRHRRDSFAHDVDQTLAVIERGEPGRALLSLVLAEESEPVVADLQGHRRLILILVAGHDLGLAFDLLGGIIRHDQIDRTALETRLGLRGAGTGHGETGHAVAGSRGIGGPVPECAQKIGALIGALAKGGHRQRGGAEGTQQKIAYHECSSVSGPVYGAGIGRFHGLARVAARISQGPRPPPPYSHRPYLWAKSRHTTTPGAVTNARVNPIPRPGGVSSNPIMAPRMP